jgi:hypothetical protein
MTTPPPGEADPPSDPPSDPPLPWEAHPPEPGDEDTSPVRVLTPRVYPSRFTEPLAVDPRTTTVKRQGNQSTVVAAAVSGVALVGILGWVLWPSATSASSTATVDAEAQNRLTALLPAGYSEDACTPAEGPKGAVAMVNCTKNTDAGGPPSATYALMKDEAALSAAVDAALADADVVDCPGNIQSPGPWRRNATPQKVAGTLVCGMPHGQPQVVWTNDAQLVLNVVRAGPEGPTLDQMYAWWSDHS